MSDLHWPDRPFCFGKPGFTNATCTVPTPAMITWLNITDPKSYRQAYCLNPPEDSCEYGYCPNPDIASPAVRYATYVSSICLSILILYSPDDIMGAFYAQLLSTYSLIVAAIISIGQRQLTRLHAVFALAAAGSPLSIYLILYALRSTFGKVNRLEVAFGEGKIHNRVLVLLLSPLWIAVLGFTALPIKTFQFQQIACDEKLKNRVVRYFFYGPFTLLVDRAPAVVVAIVSPPGLLALAWLVAIYRERAEIWKKKNTWFPYRRMWRKVVDPYPFIQFVTVIMFPSIYWIATLENGAMFSAEYFTPTYGQLLAIFVAVQPLVQTMLLLPRMGRWFADLTWVRFLTGRRSERRFAHHRRSEPSMSSMGTYDALLYPTTSGTTPGDVTFERLQSHQPTLPLDRSGYGNYPEMRPFEAERLYDGHDRPLSWRS